MNNLLTNKHTIVDLVNERVSSQPDKRLYTFLGNADTKENVLTCGELLIRAKALAGYLQKKAAGGERIILLLPPGITYITSFFACLFAGVIAVPAYPPKRDNSVLAAIVRNAGARTVLSSAEIIGNIHSQAGDNSAVKNLEWIDVDAIAKDEASA